MKSETQERTNALDKLYRVAERTQRGSTFAAFDEVIQAVEQASWSEPDSHKLMMESLHRAIAMLESQITEGVTS